jgi:putative ABC transport system permease protein
MSVVNLRLFRRIMFRNLEVYILKILTLATAFASSAVIILFSLHEFTFDRFHHKHHEVFRVLQKNTDESYHGNRLSMRIPATVTSQFTTGTFKDRFAITRVATLNSVNIIADAGSFEGKKIHVADPSIHSVFSFELLHGDTADFNSTRGLVVMMSSRAAINYTGTPNAVGKKVTLFVFNDSLEAHVVAVYKDFPENTHDDFRVFLIYNDHAIKFVKHGTDSYNTTVNSIIQQEKLLYIFQPVSKIYFGPRVVGEEARHGDSYSVTILLSIAGLILFLGLTSFINLTTITLPHRSKEVAVKKIAGISQAKLLDGFILESSAVVGISFLTGLVIIVLLHHDIEGFLGIQIFPLLVHSAPMVGIIVLGLLLIFTFAPVFMTLRFVRSSPNRLLSTDTITFPRLKQFVTFLQLGVSIFLIVASVVIRRQISYSIVKEPGQNYDQIVYLNSPSGITNEGIVALRSGWKKYNPNILDVMAVSQLPDRINSREIGSEFYLLLVDHGFREFFDLKVAEGNWFGPNSGDSAVVINMKGKDYIPNNEANVIGVVENLGAMFNQPEKPVKIKLGPDYNYNWLCVRVLEVDIRRTVRQLTNQLSYKGQAAIVQYLSLHFKSWIDYQDKLNSLSGLLAIVSALLSCCAIYGLTISLARDKLKEIAVHKLFGAGVVHITYLLVLEFVKQMLIALAVFGPLSYILLNELLRSFVYSTGFCWLDPVYPIAYCACVIIAICGFQALSLNRSDFSSALKG